MHPAPDRTVSEGKKHLQVAVAAEICEAHGGRRTDDSEGRDSSISCLRTRELEERGYHSVEIGTPGLYAQFVPYELRDRL